MRLDRIYATPDSGIVKVWTDTEARAYSDHLPVIADIEISAPGR
jgi:endonuclease/exonuclease/phosphatase family metal-dependent hydrolase